MEHPAYNGAVHTKLLPVLVALYFGVVPWVFGQAESVLRLEAKPGKPPFRNGEQLEIQCDATLFAGVTRITVLDSEHWPWVRVKWERGETWLNFDHVVIAKIVATTK